MRTFPHADGSRRRVERGSLTLSWSLSKVRTLLKKDLLAQDVGESESGEKRIHKRKQTGLR